MTQILCRLDHENKPVVFIADTLNNGRMKAWQEGDEKPKYVGFDYYKNTTQLSEADSKVLAKRFAEATGQEVYIRQRLPRTYRKVPNILAVDNDQKKGRANARSEAAKRRVEAEQQVADVLNEAVDMQQEGKQIDDEKLQKLSVAIAKALLEAGL